MSDLVVIGFENTQKAEEVLWQLRSLKRQPLIDLEDAVVVVRDEQGEIHLKQSINLTHYDTSTGLLSGGLLGTFVGMLFLNPAAGLLIGTMIGAGAGALSGSLTDYGIPDDFIMSLGETIPLNSSALFILARKVEPEKILAEIGEIKGKVLRTNLSQDQEQRLKEALEGPRRTAPT